MAKVKKFAMGGMNLNRSSRRPPPQPVRPPPKVLQAKPFMGSFNNPAGRPVAVSVQAPSTSGTPAGLANLQRAIQNPSQSSMGSGPMPVASQSPVQVQNTSGTPAGLGAMGGGLSEAQLSGLRNNLGPQSAPANAAAMMNDINTGMGSRPSSVGGMKKGGSVKSSASKRADGCAIRGKTRGKIV
jgi:hypothetical protein